MRNIHAIILAGGTGTRLGGDKPKQFLEIAGKPLILYSLERFKKWGLCKSITIVCHTNWIELMEKTVGDKLEGIDQIIEGGKTRHESTLNAIRNISWDREDMLLIHDAARPFFLDIELDELIGTARIFGASTLALPATETVVLSKSKGSYTESSLPRDELYFVKTPQAVSGNVLERLLALGDFPQEVHPTDLCSWVERLGEKTGIVLCDPKNIKVTRSEDTKIALSYLMD